MEDVKQAKGTSIQNPLGTQPVGGLLLKFAIPAIAGQLIETIYNISDQVWIGHGVGYLGNAATNIAFPITLLCSAIANMFGIGVVTSFNLLLGAGKKDDAAHVAGTSLTLMTICGVVLGIIVFVFVEPLVKAFGATERILPYAVTYSRIIAVGMPFFVISLGASSLIRADGSPGYAMFAIVAGCGLNMILDPIFVFVLKLGIAGPAYTSVIGQVVSFILVMAYMPRFKNAKITAKILRPRFESVKSISRLGVSALLNFFMTMVTQIIVNNMLRIHGATSVYGSDIAIAVAGVVVKISSVVDSFSSGTGRGAQPILAFNFGAKNYIRVKEIHKLESIWIAGFSIIVFLCFQLFPRQIVSIFGTGNELYYQFAERYMRICMMMICLTGIGTITRTLFTSIGKPYISIFITILQNLFFLIPLVLILPRFFGLNGVVYSRPIADFLYMLVVFTLTAKEFRTLTQLEQKKNTILLKLRFFGINFILSRLVCNVAI